MRVKEPERRESFLFAAVSPAARQPTPVPLALLTKPWKPWKPQTSRNHPHGNHLTPHNQRYIINDTFPTPGPTRTILQPQRCEQLNLNQEKEKVASKIIPVRRISRPRLRLSQHDLHLTQTTDESPPTLHFPPATVRALPCRSSYSARD